MVIEEEMWRMKAASPTQVEVTTYGPEQQPHFLADSLISSVSVHIGFVVLQKQIKLGIITMGSNPWHFLKTSVQS